MIRRRRGRPMGSYVLMANNINMQKLIKLSSVITS